MCKDQKLLNVTQEIALYLVNKFDLNYRMVSIYHLRYLVISICFYLFFFDILSLNFTLGIPEVLGKVTTRETV